MSYLFKHIDYNRLRSFLEVGHMKSISKAAKKLGRSQSALSQSMQKLEEEIGLKLIEIIEKKVCLTPQGQHVFLALQNYLSPLEDKMLKLLNQAEDLEGLIKIGILQDFSTTFDITKVIMEFQSLHPKIKLEIKLGTSQSIEEDLFTNSIDFGLLINFKYSQHIKKISVMEERHFLCAQKDLLIKKNYFEKIENIFEERIVDLTPNFVTLKAWFAKFFPKLKHRLQGLSPDISLPSFFLNKELVLKGHAVGVLPEKFVDLHKSIDTIPANKKKFLTVRLDLAYRKTKKISPLEKSFQNFLTSREEY